MAKILPGSPFSGASGRIGNLVTYNLKGVQVIRTLPGTRKKGKTSRLQSQHIDSFKAQHAIAKSIKKELIDRIWSHLPFSGGMNPYNQFIKQNRAAYGGTGSIVFPELMMISNGNLLPAAGVTTQKEEGFLKITWNTTSGKYSSPTDKLNLVLLEFQSSLKIIDVVAQRNEGEIKIALPNYQSDVIEGFIFWSSEDDTCFSPSMYWKCKLASM